MYLGVRLRRPFRVGHEWVLFLVAALSLSCMSTPSIGSSEQA
jgi:hypothetical protein